MLRRIGSIPLTLPNILSCIQVNLIPFVLIALIFTGKYNLFVFFMWLNLTTDILDGWIARKLNQVTETGAMLDGIADTATYILGLIGIFMFKWTDFIPFCRYHFIAFLAMFLSSRFFSFH